LSTQPRDYLDALKAARPDSLTDAQRAAVDDWFAWAEECIARRLAADANPELVFLSVGNVTTYTYRD
jgi:hypothetical protein